MFSLRQWWRQAQRPMLGVDLGADAVRVVALGASVPRRSLRIAHFAQQALPRGAMRDGAIVMPDEVAAALREAIRASGSRLRDAALALPAGAAIRKTLSLPALLHEDEMEMQVEAEAGETLPFPRDEIGLDFTIGGPTAGQPDCVDVVLVAARRERIDERVALARAAGLRPLVIDIESQALASAIALLDAAHDGGPAPVLAALRLEPERGLCLFMADGVLSYERELVLPTPAGDTAAVERACQEFDRALQLFQTATTHAVLHRIYLLGAVPEGLAPALQRRTGAPVVRPGLSRHSAGAAAAEVPTSCLLACGLALRGAER